MADPEATDAEPDDPARRERHATNLELFLDLVFVFAVTQLAVLIEGHLTVPGVLRGVLLAFLVWWQWSQFTWAGAAMDLQAHTVSRLLVLCMVPVTLLMTVAIPDAFDRSGPWFGWAYFGVQVLVISMMGVADRPRNGPAPGVRALREPRARSAPPLSCSGRICTATRG